MGQVSHCMQCGDDFPPKYWVQVPDFITIFQMLGHRELFCSDHCYQKFRKDWCF